MNMLNAVNISMEFWGCLLSLLIVIYILQEKRPWSPRSRAFCRMALCQAAIMLCDALAYLCEGRPSFSCRRVVVAGNFLVFLLGYVMLVLFTRYLTVYLQESGPVTQVPFHIIRILALIGVALAIISQFNHMYYVIDAENRYIRRELFPLSTLIALLGMCVNAGFLIACHKRIDPHDKKVFLIYFLIPMAAMAAQSFVFGLALMNFANTVALVVVFLFIQMNYARQTIRQQELLLQQKAALADSQTKLAQTRMDLMRSQIQPHFIYNTLGTISELCLSQPEKAAEIAQEFSQYLRGNFDELESRTPIRLSREIKHVRHYTAIEHVRFPDMDIQFDLQSREFFLPALSIQPLVENAIKHGLMGLESGGCVVISTFETADSYCVSVRDNGVGFDTTAPLSTLGRKHLGISNIRERVETMCGGSLTIESAPGYGTTALISIPKEDTV